LGRRAHPWLSLTHAYNQQREEIKIGRWASLSMMTKSLTTIDLHVEAMRKAHHRSVTGNVVFLLAVANCTVEWRGQNDAAPDFPKNDG
jgi:hypothetical protein